MPGIHEKACDMVVDYEKAHGRNARDVSKSHKKYDVVGTRNIEVKATKHSKIPGIYYFERGYWERFLNNPEAWLYIVYDMNREPKLLKLSRELLLKCETGPYRAVWVKIPRKLRETIEF